MDHLGAVTKSFSIALERCRPYLRKRVSAPQRDAREHPGVMSLDVARQRATNPHWNVGVEDLEEVAEPFRSASARNSWNRLGVPIVGGGRFLKSHAVQRCSLPARALRVRIRDVRPGCDRDWRSGRDATADAA